MEVWCEGGDRAKKRGKWVQNQPKKRVTDNFWSLANPNKGLVWVYDNEYAPQVMCHAFVCGQNGHKILYSLFYVNTWITRIHVWSWKTWHTLFVFYYGIQENVWSQKTHVWWILGQTSIRIMCHKQKDGATCNRKTWHSILTHYNCTMCVIWQQMKHVTRFLSTHGLTGKYMTLIYDVTYASKNVCH